MVEWLATIREFGGFKIWWIHGAYTLIHERNVLQKFDMSNRSKSFGVCIK